MATTLLLDLDALRAVLGYCPTTGRFWWKKSRGRAKAGSDAGNVDPDTGYVRIRVLGKLVYAHRLAWAFVTGAWPAHDVDHRNCKRTDNRFRNLRPATDAENARNSTTPKNSQSGLKGAYFYTRDAVWVSEITVNRKKIYLGRHPTKEAAHAAYCRAAEKHFGQFARAA